MHAMHNTHALVMDHKQFPRIGNLIYFQVRARSPSLHALLETVECSWETMTWEAVDLVHSSVSSTMLYIYIRCDILFFVFRTTTSLQSTRDRFASRNVYCAVTWYWRKQAPATTTISTSASTTTADHCEGCCMESVKHNRTAACDKRYVHGETKTDEAFA